MKNKLITSIPELSLLFIDTPLESTLKSDEFHSMAKGVIMRELRHRKEHGLDTKKPVMIVVLERESLLGEMGSVKSGTVIYSPETNIMACFKGEGQLIG